MLKKLEDEYFKQLEVYEHEYGMLKSKLYNNYIVEKENLQNKIYDELAYTFWTKFFNIFDIVPAALLGPFVYEEFTAFAASSDKCYIRLQVGLNYDIDYELSIVDTTTNYTISVMFRSPYDYVISYKNYEKTDCVFSQIITKFIDKINDNKTIHKLYGLSQYIFNYSKKLTKTDYINHVTKARMFLLCNNVTKNFPHDISNLIYNLLIT
jgi:hypothetical protein